LSSETIRTNIFRLVWIIIIGEFTKTLKSMTSHEAFKGKKLLLKWFKTFRCCVLVLNLNINLSKLTSRMKEMIFLETESNTLNYKLWNTETRKMVYNHNIHFIKNKFSVIINTVFSTFDYNNLFLNFDFGSILHSIIVSVTSMTVSPVIE
jgi:hypothetical protein